jgi:NADH:ubiquinone oxidoreductase subunit F (NADH-binding)
MRRLLAGPPVAGLADHLAAHGVPRWPARPEEAAQLIAEVEAAGLAGRGGAGFPTAQKWRSVASQGRRPVVVANCAEGEPASAKDRVLMSHRPHLVIDGAVYAACAVGARRCYLYVVAPLAAHAERAVAERRRAGLDPVEVEVVAAPAAYLAGEESAVVHHLNGGPPAQPTFVGLARPYQRGVGGAPTLVNNAETLAHAALIARRGSAWFRQAGSPAAPGTALVTVSGAVCTPGVIEVELGSRLGQAVEAVGGPSQPVQAFLVGGYFGTWVPARAGWEAPLDPPGLAQVGASLGAGVVVALAHSVCGLAETARICAWLDSQKAGQCGPCRLGLPALSEHLSRLARPGVPARLADLAELMGEVAGRGACRHPDGVVRLVSSALSVFADELEAHARGACSSAGATQRAAGG